MSEGKKSNLLAGAPCILALETIFDAETMEATQFKKLHLLGIDKNEDLIDLETLQFENSVIENNELLIKKIKALCAHAKGLNQELTNQQAGVLARSFAMNSGIGFEITTDGEAEKWNLVNTKYLPTQYYISPIKRNEAPIYPNVNKFGLPKNEYLNAFCKQLSDYMDGKEHITSFKKEKSVVDIISSYQQDKATC